MERYRLRMGDQSIVGGTITDGDFGFVIDDRATAVIGGEVQCPACSSVGVIVAFGPRHYDYINGRMQALDGDLCACNCSPSPVLQASQWFSSHSFDGYPDGYSGWANFHTTEFSQTERRYDECVRLRNRRTGQPLANVSYRVLLNGSVFITGRTDTAGLTQRISAPAAITLEIQVREN
jgi:uncharacterized Zn-binding protein involved in type VI secretion